MSATKMLLFKFIDNALKDKIKRLMKHNKNSA